MDAHVQLVAAPQELVKRLSAEMKINTNFNSPTFSQGVAKDAGADQLKEFVAQLGRELTEYDPRLIAVIPKSATVRGNLQSLTATLNDLETFLTKLAAKKVLFFSSTKYRAKIANFLHLLRSKSTQLLTSITLELLTSQQQPQSPRAPRTQGESSPHETERSPLDEVTKTVPVDEEPFSPQATSVPPPTSIAEATALLSPTEGNQQTTLNGTASFYGIPPLVKNYTVAAEAFAVAASGGDGDAMLMLSECYEHGWGVEQDAPMSTSWLEKAVAAGSRAAMHRNAMQVLKALDLHDAAYLRAILRHFSDGSQNGLALAPAPLPAPVAVDPARARRRGSVNSTSSAASCDTAVDCAHRREVDAVFLQQAVQLLLLAAADRHGHDHQGRAHPYPPAMTDLGVLHELAADMAQAVHWFTRAHAAGCPRATNKLGVLHYQGQGVARDIDRAFELFAAAALAGDKDANNNAGRWLEQHVGGCSRSGGTWGGAQRALVYYERGAALGSVLAMYNAGYLKLQRAIDVLRECDERAAGLEPPVGASYAASVLSALTDGPGSSGRDDAAGDVREWRGARSSSSSVQGLPPLPPSRQPHARTFSDAHAMADAHADLAHDRADAADMARDGVRWLRAAAEGGVAEASFQMGLVYHEGLGGVARDASAAIAHFERAAVAGHTHAALSAAEAHYQRLLAQPDGSDARDFRVCAEYYLLAAASGASVVAMNAIGLLLEDGRGSADLCPDAVGAMGWYFQACVVGTAAAPSSSSSSSSGRSVSSPYSAARSPFSATTSASAMSPSSFAPSPTLPDGGDDRGDEEEDHLAMQEAAVNLGLLLAVNPDVNYFPSARGGGAVHSAEDARFMLGGMLAGGGSAGSRWRPHLLERLAAVLASMSEGGLDDRAVGGDDETH